MSDPTLNTVYEAKVYKIIETGALLIRKASPENYTVADLALLAQLAVNIEILKKNRNWR